MRSNAHLRRDLRKTLRAPVRRLRHRPVQAVAAVLASGIVLTGGVAMTAAGLAGGHDHVRPFGQVIGPRVGPPFGQGDLSRGDGGQGPLQLRLGDH